MLRILWCGFGLGVASLTVLLVTLFVPIFPRIVTWHDPKGMLALILVGGLLAGIIVYPSFTFAAYVRLRKSITSPYYWICVGGIVAAFVNVCVAVVFMPYTDFTIVNSSIPAGLTGGLIYSFFHDVRTFDLLMTDCKSFLSKVFTFSTLKISQTRLRPSIA